jgi:hypothetical protein
MQENEPNQNDRRGGGDNGFNWKGLILLSVAMGLFGLAIWSKSLLRSSKAMNYAEFKKLVIDGKIHVDRPPSRQSCSSCPARRQFQAVCDRMV